MHLKVSGDETLDFHSVSLRLPGSFEMAQSQGDVINCGDAGTGTLRSGSRDHGPLIRLVCCISNGSDGRRKSLVFW